MRFPWNYCHEIDFTKKKPFILLCYRSSFSPNGVNCLLSDMSTSQLTENDLTRTSSSSDPDWDVFELNSNCDDPDNGGGGSLPGRNTDGEWIRTSDEIFREIIVTKIFVELISRKRSISTYLNGFSFLFSRLPQPG